jgi:HPt (histidine-containing phosphotransfer) domain-containing protein/CheY-like chemotaxis protein
MSSPQETLQDKLAALRKVYAEQLPAKLADVEAAWLDASKSAGGGAGFSVLHRLLHGLTGSGATFGFAALSDAARVAEIATKALLEQEEAPSAAQLEQLGAQLAALKRAAAKPEQSKVVIADVQPSAGRVPLTQSESRLLYLVEDDVVLGQDLALQIGFFGYTVRVFTQPSQISEAVAAVMPAAIIMAVAFPEGDLAGPDLARHVHAGLHRHRARQGDTPAGSLRQHPHRVLVGGNRHGPPTGGNATGRGRFPHQADPAGAPGVGGGVARASLPRAARVHGA